MKLAYPESDLWALWANIVYKVSAEVQEQTGSENGSEQVKVSTPCQAISHTIMLAISQHCRGTTAQQG